MNRDFKGVWIDKTIWLTKELSLIEKCLFTEINSLDNSKGCFASNEYFAEFLNCSVATITRSVKNLKKKKLIKVSEFNGRQRTIKINATGLTCLIKLINQVDQIDQDNNTVNNSTISEDIVRERQGSLTPPTKEKKPKLVMDWRKAQELTNYLESKSSLGLDGGENDKYQIRNLMVALVNRFPNQDWVEKAKEIIDIGYQDQFHSKNLTNFRYLYNHWVRILKHQEEKQPEVQKTKKNLMELTLEERTERAKTCNRGCDRGMVQHWEERNGRRLPIGVEPCECSIDIFEKYANTSQT